MKRVGRIFYLFIYFFLWWKRSAFPVVWLDRGSVSHIWTPSPFQAGKDFPWGQSRMLIRVTTDRQIIWWEALYAHLGLPQMQILMCTLTWSYSAQAPTYPLCYSPVTGTKQDGNNMSMIDSLHSLYAIVISCTRRQIIRQWYSIPFQKVF